MTIESQWADHLHILLIETVSQTHVRETQLFSHDLWAVPVKSTKCSNLSCILSMATTKVRPRNTSGRHNSTTVFVQKTKRRASSDIKRLKVRGSSVATVSSSGSEVNTCISEGRFCLLLAK